MGLEIVMKERSEILSAIYEYLGSKLKPYNEEFFYYEDGFLRASESSEYLFVEFADNEEWVKLRITGDEDCYSKNLGAKTIIDFVHEEWNI